MAKNKITMTGYTVTIKELLLRPIIREDQVHEYLNKMTDVEIKQRDVEIFATLDENKVPRKFPDWNAAWLSAIIDTDILYRLFRQAEDCEFESL